MNISNRKLRIIEALSALKDIEKITQIESLVLPQADRNDRQLMLNELSGSWSEEEAEDVKKEIEDGCEKIDSSEW